MSSLVSLQGNDTIVTTGDEFSVTAPCQNDDGVRPTPPRSVVIELLRGCFSIAAMDMATPGPLLLVDHFPAARRSLRLAYLTETYPPEVNGVSLSTARVVQGLQQRNHDLQLIRPRQHALDIAEQAPGLQEVLTRGLPIPKYPTLRMGLASKQSLVKLWSRRRPDVVHLATEGPLCWAALQAARLLKIPVSSDFRTNFHAYSQHYGLGWLGKPILGYLRKFHNHTQCTFVPTEALRMELAGRGFKPLQVVGRGVDTLRFSSRHRDPALRAQWGAGPDDPVLLYVGRLAAEKNLALVVEAFRRAREQRPGTHLVLVGDGPLRSELQAQAQTLPNLHLAGQRRGEDLAAHYASADLFVFASTTETFGNVVPEALASGLPVLAFRHAAAGELVLPGLTGSLVAPGHAANFVEEAAGLATDRGRLRAMGTRAQASMQAHGWESVVDRFESALLALLPSSLA